MRVLQIHNRHRYLSGEDTVVALESQLLTKSGHELIDFSVENPDSNLHAAWNLAMSPWNPIAASRIERVVEAQNPDLAHVHNTWFSLSPSVIHKLHALSVPTVVTLHSFRLVCANGLLLRSGRPCRLCVGSHPWHAVRYACYRDSRAASALAATTISLSELRQIVDLADLFVAVSQFSCDVFIDAGIPAGKLVVKPNFVVDPGPRKGPPSMSNRVLYAGRISDEKGLDWLLQAWESFKHDGLRLDVYGDGPARRRLEALKVPGVRFKGPTERHQVLKSMLSARALVLPSIAHEGNPLVLLEAMSCGLPILASAVGGVPEMLESLGEGFLVPPFELDALVDGLRRLGDDTFVDQSSSLLRSIYEQRFSPHRALVELEKIYESVLSAPRRA